MKPMKVRELRQDELAAKGDWAGWHVLTVAEAGFSMLDIYGRDEVGIAVIREFADRVNDGDEPGSLHPRAAISALPRRFFRDSVEPDAATLKVFRQHLQQFIKVNESEILAPRVVVDFHVSSAPVPVPYVKATIAAFAAACESTSVMTEVVVLS